MDYKIKVCMIVSFIIFALVEFTQPFISIGIVVSDLFLVCAIVILCVGGLLTLAEYVGLIKRESKK